MFMTRHIRQMLTLHHALEETSSARLVSRLEDVRPPTHLAVGIAMNQRIALSARDLPFQRSCHGLTLGMYHHEAPDQVQIFAEFHSARPIVHLLRWRMGARLGVPSHARMRAEVGEDETSYSCTFHYEELPALYLTATYPRYIRSERSDPLVHATARVCVRAAQARTCWTQRGEPAASWTLQSHRSAPLMGALLTPYLGAFTPRIEAANLYHHLTLHTATTSLSS